MLKGAGPDGGIRTHGLMLPKHAHCQLCYIWMVAERVGFGPTVPVTESPVFKTGSLNRSDNAPCVLGIGAPA